MATTTEIIDPDDTLAERARRGSGAAFAALVARHIEGVYAIAANLCATSDVEAVLQQAFLAAWRGIVFLPAGERFTIWLQRIALATARSHRRRESCTVDSWHEPMKITGLLRAALECLDDQARAAFVLRDLLDLTADEAAAILEVSPAAVRRDSHRARLMLRDFIDQLEGGLSPASRRTS